MALHSARWREVWFTVGVTVYGDAGGSSHNEAAIVLAGFMGNAGRWLDFDNAWLAFLHRHRLTMFHDNELPPEPDRSVILDDAISIITRRDYDLKAFVILVDTKDFKEYQAIHGTDPRRSLGAGNEAYPFAAQSHIANIEGYCQQNNGVEPKEFIYEAGDRFQTELKESLKKRGFPEPIFREKKHGPLGLQAADFLAGEFLRAYRHGVVFDPKRVQQRKVKGTPSKYILQFAEMPGELGIFSSDNLPKLRELQDIVEHLEAIKKSAGA